jgi:predicted transcriptional regulator with HTH domain
MSVLAHGNTLSVSDIYRQTGISRSSIKGALKGTKGKFIEEHSLLSIGWVSETRIAGDERMHGYKMTNEGTLVMKYLARKNPNRCGQSTKIQKCEECSGAPVQFLLKHSSDEQIAGGVFNTAGGDKK